MARTISDITQESYVTSDKGKRLRKKAKRRVKRAQKKHGCKTSKCYRG
jgi:hypothetical protein